MGLLVRLIERPAGEPVVRIKERHDADVVHLIWPRNDDYQAARAAASQYFANCLAQAVEAPRR